MDRIIILGDKSFVGSNIKKELTSKKFDVHGINRNEVDLNSNNAVKYLRDFIKDDDIVVIPAAKAPAKNSDDLESNISLVNNIIKSINDKKLKYVLNISSDAVYADSSGLIDENSLLEPQGFHGTMHSIREFLIEKNLKTTVGHLRPTLIYGLDDPHNGYGPNSFLRKSFSNDDIKLFGKGEEQRDHIHIDDVAKIAVEMILKKIKGPINAVSGKVISFDQIAKIIQKKSKNSFQIKYLERKSPMPHNGYRAFDNSKAKSLMPNFQFKILNDYLIENLK